MGSASMDQSTKIKELLEIVGGLSKPSKMPGYAYGIPAKDCISGSKMRKVEGSVCFSCYALKGRYAFPAVQQSLQRRKEALGDARWVQAMALLIQKKKIDYFRWHDSGDLQSEEHLDKIVQIAKACPDTKFWLPTRENGIVHRYKGEVPDNLVIRVSGAMIDGILPIGFRHVSGVASKERFASKASERKCPSSNQHNKCMACRACWDKNVREIWYKAH